MRKTTNTFPPKWASVERAWFSAMRVNMDAARRAAIPRPEIKRVVEGNWWVYGVRKVWRQREGFDVARCAVARPMKGMGIQGSTRGKLRKTAIPDKKATCPLDKDNRQFRVLAPNVPWVG